MVFVNEGSILCWNEISQNLEKIKSKLIKELVVVYKKHKDIKNDPFRWGDELELTLIKFDHTNKKCYLLLKSEEFFDDYLKSEELRSDEDSFSIFHNEYTSYMIEAIPAQPVDEDVNSMCNVQQNMKYRKNFIQNFLKEDEYVISLTSFPLLGCPNFTIPAYNPTDIFKQYNSMFYSNDIILDRSLFKSATFNKIDRIRSQPIINVPIFEDLCTPKPFIEELPNGLRSKPNFIYMDHDGFAMGCCCIQVTFQASNCREACYLHDMLTPIAPIIIALSASSPIWRGYLSDIDCRWNVLKQAFDDRTEEELGFSPLVYQRHILKKSRFDTTDCYLSSEGSKYNDFEFDKDEQVFQKLIDEGMDTTLAQHFANMFTRDPFLVFEEDLKNEDDEFSGNFDIFNCTNWRLLRFKPPPTNSVQNENKIGWRIEFRPTEIQFSDFENSAFCTFIILLARTIKALNLNFLIGITKVSQNMDRAQNVNACIKEKFFFRQNVEDNGNALVAEMSVNEIINGTDGEFKGLIYYIKEYLKSTEIKEENQVRIGSYLKFLQLRADGKLLTPATWIRKFVRNHEQYKFDSKITEEINYDLIWSIYCIANGQTKCNDLLP